MHTIAHHHSSMQTSERVRMLLTRYRIVFYLGALLLVVALVSAEARNRAGAPYPVDDRPLVLPDR